MNLITKLLMENEARIFFKLPDDPYEEVDLKIVIQNISCEKARKYLDKKVLLSEVQEQYYVSNLEWELLNYWKEIGVEKIYKNKNNDDIVLCGLSDHYLQPSSMYQIFQFIKHEEYYVLDDLINRCALIEG